MIQTVPSFQVIGRDDGFYGLRLYLVAIPAHGERELTPVTDKPAL